MVYISLINYYILNWIFDDKIWIVTIFYKWKNKPINFVIIWVHCTYIVIFDTSWIFEIKIRFSLSSPTSCRKMYISHYPGKIHL